MKQFIVDRTGATPQLDQVPTERIRIYATEQDAIDDIANIGENEIVAVSDQSESDTISVLLEEVEAVKNKAAQIQETYLPVPDSIDNLGSSLSNYTCTKRGFILITMNTTSSGGDYMIGITLTKPDGTSVQFANGTAEAGRGFAQLYRSSVICPVNKGDVVSSWTNTTVVCYYFYNSEVE